MSKHSANIIMVGHKNLELLKESLSSVFNYSETSHNLILVNNGSDSIREYFKELKEGFGMRSWRVQIINFPKNVGLGRAIDAATRYCDLSLPYIFRLDSDLLVKTLGWDVKMMDSMNKNKEVGAVGTIHNIDQKFNIKRNEGTEKEYLETEMIIGCCQCVSTIAIEKMKEFLEYNRVQFLGKVWTYLSLTKDPERRRALQNLYNFFQQADGFWDPGYYYGVDDFDFSYFIRYCGMTLAGCDIDIEHKNASMDDSWKDIRKKHVHEGFNYFRWKWEIINDFWGWKGVWDPYGSLPLNLERRKEFENYNKLREER